MNQILNDISVNVAIFKTLEGVPIATNMVNRELLNTLIGFISSMSQFEKSGMEIDETLFIIKEKTTNEFLRMGEEILMEEFGEYTCLYVNPQVNLPLDDETKVKFKRLVKLIKS